MSPEPLNPALLCTGIAWRSGTAGPGCCLCADLTNPTGCLQCLSCRAASTSLLPRQQGYTSPTHVFRPGGIITSLSNCPPERMSKRSDMPPAPPPPPLPMPSLMASSPYCRCHQLVTALAESARLLRLCKAAEARFGMSSGRVGGCTELTGPQRHLVVYLPLLRVLQAVVGLVDLLELVRVPAWASCRSCQSQLLLL